MKDIVKNWKKAQDAGADLPCPRCGGYKNRPDAVSRVADIYVCSQCGVEEAMEEAMIEALEEALEDPSYIRKGEHCGSDDENSRSPVSDWWLNKIVLSHQAFEKLENGHYEITVNRKVIVTDEDIDDIVAAALEGGITYWCCKADVVEDTYYGDMASDQISRGGSLRLYDSESDESYVLDRDSLINGIALGVKEGYGRDWINDDGNLDSYNIDGDAADVIVQLALFGEVIYG